MAAHDAWFYSMHRLFHQVILKHNLLTAHATLACCQ